MADLAEMHRQLEDRRAELEGLRKSSAQARGAVQLDQQSVGRISRMDAMQQQAMALAAERQRAGEISRIDAALERIRNGDFGYCLSCEEEIEARRLENNPAASLCLACARAQEK
ncbi:MAG: TraR/DksA C4-type zinc finger protein [Rhodobiaceae bacterium]|nr:TraR/DksA C4-type zinc finger protein [Rhodobiaceae bacterium]